MAFRAHGPNVPKTQSPDDNVPKTFGNRHAGGPGTIAERTKRWFLFGRPSDKRAEQAHPPRTRARSTAPSACSDSFDNIDGGPERRVYIQKCGVEQVRI